MNQFKSLNNLAVRNVSVDIQVVYGSVREERFSDQWIYNSDRAPAVAAFHMHRSLVRTFCGTLLHEWLSEAQSRALRRLISLAITDSFCRKAAGERTSIYQIHFPDDSSGARLLPGLWRCSIGIDGLTHGHTEIVDTGERVALQIARFCPDVWLAMPFNFKVDWCSKT